jgi:phosphoribosylformylglycinamidine cyclo-ligase
VRGMSLACREAGIALVGGETAEMPSVYAENDLDVVGFITGVVDREKMLTGADIKAGDILYAVNSSGLHTNGFSLARKLVFDIGKHKINDKPKELNGQSIADALLAPHANYAPAIRRIIDANIPVKGIAHITGSGLPGNVPRIIPDGLSATLDRATWTPQPIFALMQKIGNVDDMEMLNTFNMGVGLVIAAPKGLQKDLAAAIKDFPALKVWEIGRVEAGGEGVRFI